MLRGANHNPEGSLARHHPRCQNLERSTSLRSKSPKIRILKGIQIPNTASLKAPNLKTAISRRSGGCVIGEEELSCGDGIGTQYGRDESFSLQTHRLLTLAQSHW